MEMKAYKKKPLKILLTIVLGLIILIPSLFYAYLLYSRPKYAGIEMVMGLKDKVTILRDQYGIPHIEAKTDEDAYYALGFTMASERLFQMEISRRAANGELSEIIGEKTLQSDKTFKNLKVRRSMEEMLQKNPLSQNPEMEKLILAFYRGVNDYQNTHPLPIEFKILNIKPRPFTVLDGLSFVGLMSFNFAIALSQDPLFTSLESKMDPNLVDEMRVEKINSKKKIITELRPKIPYHSEIPALISYLETGYPLFDGSNGWLLGKNRTTSGAPMLVNDPHISYPHPGIWYEAHLRSNESETYGHFLPLLPFPILSHNKDKAWGLTMTLTDDMDIYREKLIGDDQFEFKGIAYKVNTYDEEIKIKGKDSYKFKLKETIHGPLLTEVLPEKNMSLKWAFLESDNNPLLVLYKMSVAKNMDEFKQAVARGVAPGLNVLYADRDNIGWWMFGRIYEKPDHVRSDFILDGSSGKDEYLRELPFAEKPHSENPASGIIVSANFRPFGFKANQRGDWQPDDRFNTIYTLLSQKEKWSVEETKELQTLSMNLDNKNMIQEILKDLVATSKNQKYIEILKQWNLESSTDSIAASIFFTLQNQIGLILLKDLSPDELNAYGKVSTSYIFIKRMINERENIWWKKFDRKQTINQAFENTLTLLSNKFGDNELNWRWGKLHTLEFAHPLGKLPPLNYIFNLGPFEIAGSSQDVNNQKSDHLKSEFNVKAGPSTRRIIDFSNIEKTWGILPVGESGHMLSPFYRNQLPDFLNNKYRPMLLNQADINKNVSFRLELIPNQ